MMKYRDVEYTVVQGIERGLWKWSASVAGVVLTGQAAIKSEAAAGAERAIDRALAPAEGADRPARGLRYPPAPRENLWNEPPFKESKLMLPVAAPSGPEVLTRQWAVRAVIRSSSILRHIVDC